MSISRNYSTLILLYGHLIPICQAPKDTQQPSEQMKGGVWGSLIVNYTLNSEIQIKIRASYPAVEENIKKEQDRRDLMTWLLYLSI